MAEDGSERNHWQATARFGPRQRSWRRRLSRADPKTDPWCHTPSDDPILPPTLEDLGVRPHDHIDWSEVEDWSAEAHAKWGGDQAPLRPVVNGRKDYSPEPLRPPRRLPQVLTKLEALDLDQVWVREIARVYDVTEAVAERWTKSPSFPKPYGYLERKSGHNDLTWDRVDVYVWVEEHLDLFPDE